MKLRAAVEGTAGSVSDKRRKHVDQAGSQGEGCFFIMAAQPPSPIE